MTSLPAAEMDSTLSSADYARLANILNRELGIKLPGNKRVMLEGRLRPRMRTLGFDSYRAYCEHLFQQGALQQEMSFLIDAVTTNKTDFFREPGHFSLLAQKLVPALLSNRPKAGAPLIKVWSAASSNGAEPYTIAMTLQELVRARPGFRFAVLGTDISTRVLEQGKKAIYPVDQVIPVPAELRQRYLLQSLDPKGPKQVRIIPELRRLVTFSRLNLMDEDYPVDRDVDVIFLRNVLIYFEKTDQEAVVRRLLGHLRPGGYLILGHSEAMIGSGMGLKQIAPAVFGKD